MKHLFKRENPYTFKKGHTPANTGKPHSKETRRKISHKVREWLKSRPPPRLGKKHTEDTILKMQHTLFKPDHVPWNKGYGDYLKGEKNPFFGKSHSAETRTKISQSLKGRFKGEKNPYWKGGYEPYYGPNWEEQRIKALERDGHRCRVCGVNKGKLDVHHIVPFRNFGRRHYLKANTLDNLITLCISCHATLEQEK